MRPRLLDLFCGAGGAAMGYHRAGFDVTGVDNRPQPRYPFEFHQGDALGALDQLDFLAHAWGGNFDAIHASPPCQDHMRHPLHTQKRHGTADLLPGTRARLASQRSPWVIENVPGAPMRVDYKLCGCIFGLGVQRERWFETSWRGFELRQPCAHPGPSVDPTRGHGWWWKKYGHVSTLQEVRDGMGIDWMDQDQLRQAIPPAYTEYIGAQLLEHLSGVAA